MSLDWSSMWQPADSAVKHSWLVKPHSRGKDIPETLLSCLASPASFSISSHQIPSSVLHSSSPWPHPLQSFLFPSPPPPLTISFPPPSPCRPTGPPAPCCPPPPSPPPDILVSPLPSSISALVCNTSSNTSCVTVRSVHAWGRSRSFRCSSHSLAWSQACSLTQLQY